MGSPEEMRPQVLLVEDNEDDVFLTRKALADTSLAVDLHHVENGRDCMSFLRREGDHCAAPTPDLILLDLKLPVMDGREVLAEIVRDPALRTLPVVILTTSRDENDLRAMYALRCSSYITKPVDFEEFQDVIRSIGQYWFGVVVLPPKRRSGPGVPREARANP